jgi:hypothetical protein
MKLDYIPALRAYGSKPRRVPVSVAEGVPHATEHFVPNGTVPAHARVGPLTLDLGCLASLSVNKGVPRDIKITSTRTKFVLLKFHENKAQTYS